MSLQLSADPTSPYAGIGQWEVLAPIVGPQGLVAPGTVIGDWTANPLSGPLGPNALPFGTSTAPVQALDPYTAAGFNAAQQSLTPVSPYAVAWSVLGVPGVLAGLPATIVYNASGGTRSFGTPPAGSPAASSGYTCGYTPGSTDTNAGLTAGTFHTNAPPGTHSNLFMW